MVILTKLFDIHINSSNIMFAKCCMDVHILRDKYEAAP